jgi:hypothetical protein
MLTKRLLVLAGLWVSGFLVYLLFFKLFVWWAYPGASAQVTVTHPLFGLVVGFIGGLYFALTLTLLTPRPAGPDSSAIFSGGCVAILAAFLTFVTISILFALYFVLGKTDQLSYPFSVFFTACISFGGVFSVWFLYSTPLSFVFGILARKILSRMGRWPPPA